MLYQTSTEGITPAMLEGFFDGWPNPPSREKHLQILQNSYRTVIAIEEETNQVTGFITAISDGILSAYIPLLEVLPDYKKQGIGKELVKRMLDELDDLYMIDLMCDEELQDYYDAFDLKRSTGMIKRNYEFQSGRNTL
ncbi:GNAT family N-acetyltransferase [Jeotgalibacillus sp. R-1-5s-1]|uniref:GNAT family N-acetyltransferase n=1 Tax=Jeotgalibacillus sp. R-1-5s-1 TaxID=2555897 RepID=UPI001069A539|nr:GNAT family N-acetyltransferase [Jeotgalibacillus sp. R-1-5s-1]TFE01868.1 GNAT family N-acetyltransferase [Jeotgalibacillus sp. R-1-5s-1]